MIAVTVNAWRSNEQSEPFEELERSERESRATIRCGMGETIDDALASRRAVPGSLEPFEGEGRTTDDFLSKEAFRADVRAFDVRTGELRWLFHTISQPGEVGDETWEDGSWAYTGHAPVWSLFSADVDLGYVYMPVTSSTSDMYGGHRPGDNLFSQSLVCVNAETGELVWHFQLVHHGLWDYDPPTAPILMDLVVDGRPIQAVTQLTKQAFAFVFDRVTGEPVWPIEERVVPQSQTPGERTSPTQPFPTKPPAFDRQGSTEDNLIDFTPELRAEALEIVQRYTTGPLFTPPTVRGDGPNANLGTIQLPGSQGGADVQGAAFDPETNMLYVPSITAPFVADIIEGDPERTNLRYLKGTRRWIGGPLQVIALGRDSAEEPTF